MPTYHHRCHGTLPSKLANMSPFLLFFFFLSLIPPPLAQQHTPVKLMSSFVLASMAQVIFPGGGWGHSLLRIRFNQYPADCIAGLQPPSRRSQSTPASSSGRFPPASPPNGLGFISGSLEAQAGMFSISTAGLV